jgi:hypothetical protein
MATNKRKTGTSLEPVIPIGNIEHSILLIRGQRVILAADLAAMYGVPVKRLNEQVKRNIDRFPEDFVLQLTRAEANAISRSQFVTLDGPERLRSQIATSNPGRGGQRYLPYAFTEHGVIMAANLLRSEQAVKVSVYVVRAFVKLRELLSTHKELATKLNELEAKLQDHDQQIIALIDAIRSLMSEPKAKGKPPIGYITEAKKFRK